MRNPTDQQHNVVQSKQYSRVCICIRLLRLEDINEIPAWTYMGD
jgi:hypothetical protein